MKRKTAKKTLRSPITLKPTAEDDKHVFRVVIETPKGSRNKYSLNPDERVFELKKVLPSGMTFPYDFGFVPSTLAEDGDPVDVLVLMDEAAFPGCVLKARLIGVIEGQQQGKNGKIRNDRIVAVEQDAHSFADIKGIADLGKQFLRELEQFFVNYHALSESKFKVLGTKGASHAMALIKRGEESMKSAA